MIQRYPKFITVPATNYRQQIGIKKRDKESISKTTIGRKKYHEYQLQRAVRETERFTEQMEASLSLNKQADEEAAECIEKVKNLPFMI